MVAIERGSSARRRCGGGETESGEGLLHFGGSKEWNVLVPGTYVPSICWSFLGECVGATTTTAWRRELCCCAGGSEYQIVFVGGVTTMRVERVN